MKGFLLVIFFLLTCSIFGETAYISVDKLPVNKDNDSQLKFIHENEKYFNHGSTQWSYSVSKSALVDGLKQALTFFETQDASNLEVNLLLGDVSSYLYNLNESTYLTSAEKYYKKAMLLAPIDYRSYWFMGKCYASANDLVHAIEYFRMAQIRLPISEPADFWEQYAIAANQADMPSTSIYAMDRAKALLGHPCEFEKSYGFSVRSHISEVNSGRTYASNELWTYTEGDKVVFTSRPLGMKINVEPDWQLGISSFDKKKSVFSIIPPSVTSSDGQEVTYSMTITAKVTTEDDDLRAFLNGMITSKDTKKEIEFSEKYPNMVSYELLDKTTDANNGGRHQYLIGVRRKQPLYPGLSLEQPPPVAEKNSGESADSSPKVAKGRFAGTIFYAVQLDACEAIFIPARHTFWDVFVNQLIIE